MNKVKNMEWFYKLIVIGLLLIVVLNPLSLILISSGIDLAVQFIGNSLQTGVEYATEYALYPMGLGAVLILLGGGAYLGQRERSNTAKLKSMKKKPSQKAGEYLSA